MLESEQYRKTIVYYHRTLDTQINPKYKYNDDSKDMYSKIENTIFDLPSQNLAL